MSAIGPSYTMHPLDVSTVRTIPEDIFILLCPPDPRRDKIEISSLTLGIPRGPPDGVVTTRRIMTTVSENFANSRAFKKAIADATKFSTDDFSFLRAYFESEKHNPSFEFKWLDKISKGGLSRDHVLSIIYGGDSMSSPASKKRKPRASPAASPRKQRRTPPPKDAKPDPQPEPEPETPKVARTATRSLAMTPPTKNLRRSKKETTRDEELSDSDTESESSESSDEDEGEEQ